MKSLGRRQIDGLCLVFLGATIPLMLMGYLFAADSSAAIQDFISDYYSARCLMQGCDPYQETQVLQTYRAEGGVRSLAGAREREIVTRNVYPPSTLAIFVPLALLPWGPAHILWMVISTLSLIVASGLVWSLGARDAPILSGLFVGFLLANSEVLVVLSNPSELVISLCIVGVWCFVQRRFLPLGVFCFAVSLALKPQITGLIWFYFLLAGGVYRKQALRASIASAALILPIVIWVTIQCPSWPHELGSNLAAFAAHGELNDPGPSSMTASNLIDLQVIFSRLRDDPAFYNLASYVLYAPFLLAWGVLSLRGDASRQKTLLALAAIAPLSLLPLHHHLYDSKLLLLTVPALAYLWSQGGLMARSALAFNLGAFLLTGDLTITLFRRLITASIGALGSSAQSLSSLAQVAPTPLMLLLTASFYLAVLANQIFRVDDAIIEPHREQVK